MRIIIKNVSDDDLELLRHHLRTTGSRMPEINFSGRNAMIFFDLPKGQGIRVGNQGELEIYAGDMTFEIKGKLVGVANW